MSGNPTPEVQAALVELVASIDAAWREVVGLIEHGEYNTAGNVLGALEKPLGLILPAEMAGMMTPEQRKAGIEAGLVNTPATERLVNASVRLLKADRKLALICVLEESGVGDLIQTLMGKRG